MIDHGRCRRGAPDDCGEPATEVVVTVDGWIHELCPRHARLEVDWMSR